MVHRHGNSLLRIRPLRQPGPIVPEQKPRSSVAQQQHGDRDTDGRIDLRRNDNGGHDVRERGDERDRGQRNLRALTREQSIAHRPNEPQKDSTVSW